MRPYFTASRCPCILSIRVRAASVRTALVVTSSPRLAKALGEYLRGTHLKFSVIWMPTIADACRRLERESADMVIVDDAIPSADDVILALHAVAPGADVLLLAGGKTEA